MKQNFLTTAQAARRLGVTPGRIRQLVLSGELEGKKYSPQVLLIPAAAAAAFRRKPRGRRPVS